MLGAIAFFYRPFLLATVTAALFSLTMPALAQSCGSGNATTDYITGTINDEAVAMHWSTGLVWKRCRQGAFYDSSSGSCLFIPGTPMTKSWNDWMNSYSPALFTGSANWGLGQSQPNRIVTGQWRMPYRQELLSLTTGCSGSPRINATIFPNTPTSAFFWSASPYKPDFGYAWEVDFSNGSSKGITRTFNNSIRPVRGGARFADLPAAASHKSMPNTQYSFETIILGSTGGSVATSWGGLRISGDGNPRVQINGTGSWVQEAVVHGGDTITVRMTSGNGGTLRTATLTLRSASVGATSANADNGGNEPWEYEETTRKYQLIAERICRVAPDGNASNDGASWSNPMTLQKALDDDDPACDQVWVKKGVYTPGSGRLASFTINRAVRVYGGFAGNETAVSQRNPALNKTVLSGDIGGDDVRDVNGITLRSQDIRGNNSYHVVSLGVSSSSSISRATVLDGLIITGGDATGPELTIADSGGGLFCRASIFGRTCSPTLNQIGFYGNRASRLGGALHAYAAGGEASPKLFRSTFSSNQADVGGAIYLDAGSGGTAEAQIEQSTFLSNTANQFGGAVAVASSGGGSLTSPKFTETIFKDNQAPRGGAMCNIGRQGAAVTMEISKSLFADNHADWGGVLYNLSEEGGRSTPLISNSTFDGNTATGAGGAIRNRSVRSDSLSRLYLHHGTMFGNVANHGGAVADESVDQGRAYGDYSNTIFWNNTAHSAGSQIHQDGSDTALSIDHSIVQGGASGIAGSNSGSFVSGSLNLNQDPLLGPLTSNGGFSQTRMPEVGSPAVDAGSITKCVTIDQRGVARPQGGQCDIGAVEQRSWEGLPAADQIFRNGFEYEAIL